MMADIKLNANNDIDISSSGDIDIANDSEDILQNAINNLRIRFGELQFHETSGNKIYNQRVGFNAKGIATIKYYCKDAILQDSRVTEVRDITVTRSKDDRYVCDILFTIVTIDGQTLCNSATINIEGGE